MEISPDFRPRVALFADTFFEANGVGTLSRHLAEFARVRNYPFLVARRGRSTGVTRDGALEVLELKRGWAAFPVDKDLYADPLLTRYKKFVAEQLSAFKPDLVHITGPGDFGFLGLWVAHDLRVPLVASWHTNLHEYISRRLQRALGLLPQKFSQRATSKLERETLRGLLRFYRTARFTLAPNQTMVDLLQKSTHRPSFLMPHGVDLSGYVPAKSCAMNGDRPFCIGFVGRLTTEKNVVAFRELERQLHSAGERNFRFLIVGEGGQRSWLQKNLQNAEMPGVLRGKDLAAAYHRMDAFVFPSFTDTFGLVILEAMASGVPVIVSPEAGARVGIQNGVSGMLSGNFADAVRLLMHDQARRQSMASAGRELAASKSWDVVFEDLYRSYAAGLALDDERRAMREERQRQGSR